MIDKDASGEIRSRSRWRAIKDASPYFWDLLEVVLFPLLVIVLVIGVPVANWAEWPSVKSTVAKSEVILILLTTVAAVLIRLRHTIRDFSERTTELQSDTSELRGELRALGNLVIW
jgi:hypothetical protein